MASASSRTTLVLVGKTGHGKSATGNSILGAKLFVSKRSCGSITSVCNLQTAMHDHREIHVIDTPGLCDTQRSADSVTHEISNCLVLAKDGVSALVLVLSADARFTDEEIKAAESLNLIFGKEVMKYVVVVMVSVWLTTISCEALKAAQDHALKMEQEKSKVKREKYEQEMFKKIEEITWSNARKNEAAIEERLEALAKSLAEINSEILRHSKEAYDRQLENLRTELDDARAENAHLKSRWSVGCTIS